MNITKSDFHYSMHKRVSFAHTIISTEITRKRVIAIRHKDSLLHALLRGSIAEHVIGARLPRAVRRPAEVGSIGVRTGGLVDGETRPRRGDGGGNGHILEAANHTHNVAHADRRQHNYDNKNYKECENSHVL